MRFIESFKVDPLEKCERGGEKEVWISTILRTLAAGIDAQIAVYDKRRDREDKTSVLLRDVHQELCKANNILGRIENQHSTVSFR